jgi:hypothetical protein
MIGAFWLGVVAGVGASMLLLRLIVQPTQQQILALLESERDVAKQEAKVYRNLLFPVMAKVDNEGRSGSTLEPVAAQVPRPVGAGSGKANPQPQNPFFNRRIPFKLRFKLAAKALNSKQQRTDALASALEQQKPSGEKTNA